MKSQAELNGVTEIGRTVIHLPVKCGLGNRQWCNRTERRQNVYINYNVRVSDGGWAANLFGTLGVNTWEKAVALDANTLYTWATQNKYRRRNRWTLNDGIHHNGIQAHLHKGAHTNTESDQSLLTRLAN